MVGEWYITIVGVRAVYNEVQTEVRLFAIAQLGDNNIWCPNYGNELPWYVPGTRQGVVRCGRSMILIFTAARSNYSLAAQKTKLMAD